MTSLNRSRAVKLILQSRCLLNLRGKSAVEGLVFHPSYPLRCVSSKTPTKPSAKGSGDADDDAPIPYTTSKALRWSVYNSYGRHKKRPWYKVAPLSIGLTVFMAWVFLRKETEIDRQLEVQLHERLPHLFTERNKSAATDRTADVSLPEDGDDETPKEK